jgi:hypothetical protein
MKSIKKEFRNSTGLESTIYDVIVAKVWNRVRRDLKDKVWWESNIAGVEELIRSNIYSKIVPKRLRWWL